MFFVLMSFKKKKKKKKKKKNDQDESPEQRSDRSAHFNHCELNCILMFRYFQTADSIVRLPKKSANRSVWFWQVTAKDSGEHSEKGKGLDNNKKRKGT